MKDFLGKELAIGDTVVLTRPQYRELVKAKVIAFTPKKVRVEYKSWLGKGIMEQYLSEPDFLVKIEE